MSKNNERESQEVHSGKLRLGDVVHWKHDDIVGESNHDYLGPNDRQEDPIGWLLEEPSDVARVTRKRNRKNRWLKTGKRIEKMGDEFNLYTSDGAWIASGGNMGEFRDTNIHKAVKRAYEHRKDIG